MRINDNITFGMNNIVFNSIKLKLDYETSQAQAIAHFAHLTSIRKHSIA